MTIQNKAIDAVIRRLNNTRFIALTYAAITLIVSLIQYFSSPKFIEGYPVGYTRYNNYVIFKQSFFHLINNQDLYILYLQQQWDLYKYSPTFALLMAPLAVLPDIVGLFLWNALNTLPLFIAIWSLPFHQDKLKVFILWFILQELLTSIQNAQSNGLMAALLILAFNSFERKKVWLAALCIVLAFYIKIFGIVAAVLFLFYPDKLKFIGYSVLWGIVLLLLPLIVISPDQLVFLYKSWQQMLAADHSASYGLSVMGWLYTWFGLELSKTLVLLAGVVLFCVPLLKFRAYNNKLFRILFLASILIWIVIFNHKAESPTFIIAMCGVGIWYFFQKRDKLNLTLVILAFVFTSLSPTDIFPPFLRQQLVYPYVLKAAFCIFIWFRLLYQLLTENYVPEPEVEKTNI
ncbi:DUF2029 domain-containing protein [Rhodocytophaga rosea]|uniref:DUF2029 domain-containing protein n=1 Tax=Rhodocytophaga rosea TaxID=2704465 RepID=A0A6C0GPC2_9BACT|nr:glycosyltransferase family 87 protein [Rhodocytophaga rosea]QHT69889.1 DUF2029 domain-containing protein [Rhodocytophaga rosea]